MTRRIVFFMLAASLAGAFAWSNPQDESYTRIARLSYIEGRVSFQHASDVDWSAASINLPLEPGDRLYTGTDGRAEIEFDDGSAFRLAENTDVEVLSLSQNLIQIRMLLGLSTLTVTGNSDFEINTPAAAFNVIREGIYRFDVVENGDTDAIVRKGELEAANNGFSQRIRPGELLHLSPSDNNPEVSLYDRRDEWNEWTDRRTADIRASGNVRYLPDDVRMGASELDQYGRWVNVDSYGTAWIPYDVDPYWSPYSVGRWCYRPFYGWTWVSYEPWGWLPYHYGRWYRNSSYGWCWLPGPAFSFNFWSPGLVTFYNGPGWVSWCPLGPGDYYDIGNYHYNHGIYSHQLAELRGLQTRAPGNLFNRDVRGAFRTAELGQFRSGSFNNRNSRWENVDRPWNRGVLVQNRLNLQPTSTSFAAAPDRPVVRPRGNSTLPPVVRNVPDQNSVSRGRFNAITNPQIPAIPPRNLRNQGSMRPGNTDASRPNGRVIQTPPNPSGNNPANSGDRGPSSPRWSGSRNSGENQQRQEAPAQGTEPRNRPSNQQNPPRRNERTVPEQKNSPQRAPDSTPRSDYRQQNNLNSTGQAIGRWNESSSGAVRTPEVRSAPVYSPPPSGNSGRWSNSNPGGARTPEVRQAPESFAPRQPAPSFERNSGSHPAPAPSSGNSNSNARRPEGDSGRRR